MDREECPILIEANVSAATCVPQADQVLTCVTGADDAVYVALLEPNLHDARGPVRFPHDADRPDGDGAHDAQLAAGAVRSAPGQITPARIIEACLFSADAPISSARLAELAEVSAKQVRLLVAELNDQYAAAGLSFRIEEIARGYQMLTQPQFQPWIAKLNKQQAQTRLSPAALETLSIVAYKQPVIRADIEAIRGVSTGEVLNRLREIGLVKIVGRAEIVGRPLLYGTTRKFLDIFGLADLSDLPPLESLAVRKSAVPLGAGRGSLAEALAEKHPAAAEYDPGAAENGLGAAENGPGVAENNPAAMACEPRAEDELRAENGLRAEDGPRAEDELRAEEDGEVAA
ncbi:MAG: SMC-Scp complex subunit ScpB [Planctomycetota bacterium]